LGRKCVGTYSDMGASGLGGAVRDGGAVYLLCVSRPTRVGGSDGGSDNGEAVVPVAARTTAVAGARAIGTTDQGALWYRRPISPTI